MMRGRRGGKQRWQELARLVMETATKGETAQRGIDMTKKRLTLDQHLEKAVAVRMINTGLHDLFLECANKFGVTHKITRSIAKAKDSFDAARSELDNEYHRICGDENFFKYGHIYYGNYKLPTVPCPTRDAQSADYARDKFSVEVREVLQETGNERI
jgi:hypothetical protein